MVRAWYHSGRDIDPKTRNLPHMLHPGEFLTIEEVAKLTGVEYFQFDADTVDSNKDFQELRNQRGYKNEDCVVISRQTIPNYDEKMERFYDEHLHADEEIRFIAAGCGYFDLRTAGSDQWIRVEVVKNDLLIVPGGIYHRFTPDSNENITARRLFTDEPKWTAIDRPEGDEHPVRQQYLQDMGIKS